MRKRHTVRLRDLDVEGAAFKEYDKKRRELKVDKIDAPTCNHTFDPNEQLLRPMRRAPVIMFAYDRDEERRKHIGVLFVSMREGVSVHDWYLDIMCAKKVDSSHPYKGLGTQMVTIFHDLARRAGKRHIQIHTTFAARVFWSKKGYTPKLKDLVFENPYKNNVNKEDMLAPMPMAPQCLNHGSVVQTVMMLGEKKNIHRNRGTHGTLTVLVCVFFF